MKILKTLLLAFPLALSACAGGMSQLIDGNREQYVLDPSFTLLELYQADVYFGGINVLEQTPNESQLNDIAYNDITQSRNDLRWQNHHTFAAMVGEEQAKQLKTYSLSNFASTEAKSALQAAQYPASYVLYVRMLSNDVRYENDESYHTDHNNKKVVERVYSAIRSGTVQADVYDLNSQTHVWSAVLDHEISNETTTERKKGSLLENVLSDVVDTMLVSPEAPSTEEWVGSMFRKIGGQLPQRKCSEIGFTECFKRSARQS